MSGLPNRRRTLQAALLAALLALATPLAHATCTAGPPLVGVAEHTPSAEFLVRADGTAVHIRTKLVWKRCAEGQSWDGTSCAGAAQQFTWTDALPYANTVTDGGAQWRVPNRKELESLVEFCGHSPAINLEVFPNTPGERFWSSTTFVAEPGRAWDVYFSDGYAGASSKSAFQHLRLVRSLGAGDLPLAQTISFGVAPALSVGASAAVAVNASSGLPVTLSSATPSICSLSGSTVTGVRRGSCIINASQDGDTSFAAAPPASLAIEIAGAGQTISFGAVPVLTVGGSGSIVATTSSGLPVSLNNLTPAVCSLVGTSVQGVAVGTCTISADQAGNDIFGAAAQARLNITVSPSTSPGGGDPPTPGDTRITINLLPGWNLIGNGGDTTVTVQYMFGPDSSVDSVWKWVLKGKGRGIRYPTWALHVPGQADKGSARAARFGYEWLQRIEPGEAFWVYAQRSLAIVLPGAPVPASAFAPAGVPGGGGELALPRGWSLITSGQNLSPGEFHAAIGGNASGMVSLWAWDAASGKWLFYSPELAARDANALRNFTAVRAYLDFTQSGKRLLPGMGFWVNRR